MKKKRPQINEEAQWLTREFPSVFCSLALLSSQKCLDHEALFWARRLQFIDRKAYRAWGYTYRTCPAIFGASAIRNVLAPPLCCSSRCFLWAPAVFMEASPF